MLHASAISSVGNINQAAINILKKYDRILIDIICDLSGQKSKINKDDLYKKLVDDGVEFWFSAKEAKSFGLVDKIITPEIDRELFGKLILPDWKEVENSGGNFSPPRNKKR